MKYEQTIESTNFLETAEFAILVGAVIGFLIIFIIVDSLYQMRKSSQALVALKKEENQIHIAILNELKIANSQKSNTNSNTDEQKAGTTHG